MRVSLRFEGVSTAGDLREKLGRLFARMERKLVSFKECFRVVVVRVVKERGVYRVRGKMRLPGRELVVEEKGQSLLGVVKRVRAGLLRQVERYKRRRG